VHVVRHRTTFFAAACALLGRSSKYRAETLLQFAIQNLPPVFRNENDVVFALSLGVT
jgi:hypothetical protein